MRGNTLRSKFVGILVASVLALGLGACGKGSVDTVVAGCDKVPGADTLHRCCDESTLVYVSIISGSSDEYEAFFYGGCAYDKKSGKFLPAIGPDVEPRTSPTDPEQNMNQQDELNEKD